MDGDDIAEIVKNVGKDPTQYAGDLNGDGIINLNDPYVVFAQWGLELTVVS